MSGQQVDPSIPRCRTAALGDTALARARKLGASHADFRFERVRYQELAVRDAVLQSASDREDLGFAVRVIAPGCLGLRGRGRAHRGGGGAGRGDRRGRWPGSAATMTPVPVELASSRCTPTSPGSRRTTSTRSRSRSPRRPRCWSSWTERLRAGAAVDHASAYLMQVQENKYYADLSGTRTTQQRVRLQPGFEGDGGRCGHLRLDGQHRAARRSRRGVPRRQRPGALGLGRRGRRRSPSCSAEKLRRRRASRPAPTTW